MRHEAAPWSDSGLKEAIGASAALHDREGSFPAEAFAELHARGLLAGLPFARGEARTLMKLLATVGRGDLNVGRLYEGHVNALWLVAGYGSPEQRREADRIAGDGELFGVWNTDRPDDPLRISDGRLVGSKTYASGIDGLAASIVTVADEAGRSMLLVPTDVWQVDRDWWRPLGMRASGSHVVSASGFTIEPTHRLGTPNDYVAEPWFSGGAIRFVAVQAGGMHAVFDIALAHLKKTGRASDPYQAQRIARMGILVETAYAWVERGADAFDAAEANDDPAVASRFLATVQAARSAVEASALDLLEKAERSVGAAGLNAPHPLERWIRDLRTYLRQPNPDGALAGFGAAVVRGNWSPSIGGGTGG